MSTPDRRSSSPWTVVVNSAAGSSADDVVDQVVAALRDRVEVTVARTSDLDDLTSALTRVPADGTVVVLGGDGSLHAVVAALDHVDRLRDVVVGLVPLGTGNDFARTIEVDPTDPVATARDLLEATERDVDLIRAGDGSVVVNAAHVGVGADAAVAAKPWKERFGIVGYAVGAIASGFSAEGFRGEVHVDGEAVPVRGRLLQVAVGNGRYIGGGTPLLPQADPFDGRLDVVVSWADRPLRRLKYAWKLRSGRHVEGDDTEPVRGTTLSVLVRGSALREGIPGNSDGELTDPATTHTWTLEPGAWRLLVPTRP
ncbi:MAG: diacylglycerol kinase family protein [Aeromicrobium sp.]|uniref:diacylglycerol/lipid kinase family protein n=1 Tax=Aeromicrobium sp. TaxID=1871063 RepID=UPI0025C5C4CF|nr:diacylglycerol kinase family protein [Aeromicrobium sp.]MCK5891505.1 diacylglycerol kinase [Aeromicrobium sp.]MDF1704745.1 diacylglycerol kinase family protein [Aeromicrobium sp.]